MKIVFVGRYNQTEQLSGPEKVAKRLFHEIAAQNPNAVFVEYFFKGIRKSNSWLRLFGNEPVSSSPRILRLGIIKLFTLLIKESPDIIHIITQERFIASMFIYKFFLKGKICITLHGIQRYETARFRVRRNRYQNLKDVLVEKIFFAFCDKIFFLSPQQYEIAKNYYAVLPGKYRFIPNGVDEQFAGTEHVFESREEINIVLYNGWDLEVKGISNIIPVLESLEARKPIIVNVLGYSGNVSFKNPNIRLNVVKKMDASELSVFLKRMDIHINSSIYDPFPLFVLECMASGVVVILSDRAGNSSYIKNKENGFVFDPDKCEELKSILDEIFAGRVNLQYISRNAAEIIKKLSWNKVAKQYSALYYEMLNEA